MIFVSQLRPSQSTETKDRWQLCGAHSVSWSWALLLLDTGYHEYWFIGGSGHSGWVVNLEKTGAEVTTLNKVPADVWISDDAEHLI